MNDTSSEQDCSSGSEDCSFFFFNGVVVHGMHKYSSKGCQEDEWDVVESPGVRMDDIVFPCEYVPTQFEIAFQVKPWFFPQ